MNGIRMSLAAGLVAAFAVAPAAVMGSPIPAAHGATHAHSGVPHDGAQAEEHAGNPHAHTMPGPDSPWPAKSTAYGVYCQNESKRHLAGEHGTPFSQCVTAMAKLGAETTGSPAKACATESKRHVAGQKGTPFSQCVSAAARLKAAKAAA